MIKLWVLKLLFLGNTIEYGYKFIEKSNCEAVGKSYEKRYKIKTSYSCELKKFDEVHPSGK